MSSLRVTRVPVKHEGVRLGISSSINGTEENSNQMYSREFQSMLDGLDIEESGHITEKKRCLGLNQVKALEKYFEIEEKLEPERKVKLAQELGLQPRQVAVWFQNRRARWKTKQLERDYALLKTSFGTLQHNYEALELDKDSLLNKIKVLKLKLNGESNVCIKEEAMTCDSENDIKCVEPITPPPSLSEESEDAKLLEMKEKGEHFKNGASESDSSAIVNGDNNNNSLNASDSSCSEGFIENKTYPKSPTLSLNCWSSSIKYMNFREVRSDGNDKSNKSVYEALFVKMEEEQNLFSGEEACNLFSDEAAPTLHWYSPDQWTY